MIDLRLGWSRLRFGDRSVAAYSIVTRPMLGTGERLPPMLATIALPNVIGMPSSGRGKARSLEIFASRQLKLTLGQADSTFDNRMLVAQICSENCQGPVKLIDNVRSIEIAIMIMDISAKNGSHSVRKRARGVATKLQIAAAIGLFAGLAPTSLAALSTKPTAPVSIVRLDCGDFTVKESAFSDTFQYSGERRLVGSCYLIRHGDRHLLWDSGLPESLIGRTYDTPMQSLTLKRSIVDQLAQLGLATDKIDIVGVSHWHFDHVGQAPRFANARLLIGKADADALRATPTVDEDSFVALKHWLAGSGKLELVSGDKDIFGDGSVMMLDAPGHTAGHYALLVRLASGPVLLSGDLYHFTEQVENRGVPMFNHNRADTLASMDRFERIARNLGAKVIIQHEPSDVAKLPAFPRAAE
jgi:glyoxylase-like metal-dependent hydrolase (beta-lactamase superfamily II)